MRIFPSGHTTALSHCIVQANLQSKQVSDKVQVLVGKIWEGYNYRTSPSGRAPKTCSRLVAKAQTEILPGRIIVYVFGQCSFWLIDKLSRKPLCSLEAGHCFSLRDQANSSQAKGMGIYPWEMAKESENHFQAERLFPQHPAPPKPGRMCRSNKQMRLSPF